MSNKKHSHEYEIFATSTRSTKKGDVKIYRVRCQVCGQEADKTEAQLKQLNVVKDSITVDRAEPIVHIKAKKISDADAPRHALIDPPSLEVNKTPNKLCIALLLQKTFTDMQIVDIVKAAFPKARFEKSYVSTTRNDLNKGLYKKIDPELLEEPIAQIAPEGQTVCKICGRILTDPESVAAEIGPECIKKGKV